MIEKTTKFAVKQKKEKTSKNAVTTTSCQKAESASKTATKKASSKKKKEQTESIRRQTKKAANSAEKHHSTTVKDEAEIEEELGLEKLFKTAVSNSFFYTNDHLFDQMDHAEILGVVIRKFPDFALDNDDATIKKTLLQLLNDAEFMSSILAYYNITIYEFFALLYKNYASIFKGSYLKKIKHELDTQDYSRSQRHWKH